MVQSFSKIFDYSRQTRNMLKAHELKTLNEAHGQASYQVPDGTDIRYLGAGTFWGKNLKGMPEDSHMGNEIVYITIEPIDGTKKRYTVTSMNQGKTVVGFATYYSNGLQWYRPIYSRNWELAAGFTGSVTANLFQTKDHTQIDIEIHTTMDYPGNYPSVYICNNGKFPFSKSFIKNKSLNFAVIGQNTGGVPSLVELNLTEYGNLKMVSKDPLQKLDAFLTYTVQGNNDYFDKFSGFPFEPNQGGEDK
ncbi:hypothetical protein DN451_00335 [Lactobacillus reuteri]|nr:hypothetical protein [Limosilactobacillus reuteri]